MPANRLYDMDFDEISTVDRPCNPPSLIVFAKADSRESTVADKYFDPDSGELIPDLNALEQDAVVLDEDGNRLTIDWGDTAPEGEDQFDGQEQRELQAVGKSVFLESLSKQEGDTIAELSKALREAANEEAAQTVLATALAKRDSEVAELRKTADDALAIAKAARDRELDAEYTEVAKSYNVPTDPTILGPVLKRCAEKLSKADCTVLHEVLRGSGDIFKQFGVDADIDPTTDSLADEAQRFLAEEGAEIAKSAGGRSAISKEAATVAYLDQHPEAYASRRREQRGY